MNELNEAEYQGKTVKLDKPFRTPDGPKKFAVYVKNDKGNVVMVRFGDPDMEIKRDDPGRRASFRARHNCDSPGAKWKARYWSCYQWRANAKVAEEVTVGDGGGAVNVQKDVPLFTKPSGKAFGKEYFTAPDVDTYNNIRLGKSKYQRWDSYIGKTEWAKGVSNYAKANRKGGLLLKHPTDPYFQVLRR